MSKQHRSVTLADYKYDLVVANEELDKQDRLLRAYAIKNTKGDALDRQQEIRRSIVYRIEELRGIIENWESLI